MRTGAVLQFIGIALLLTGGGCASLTGGAYKIGKPYKIDGIVYTPHVDYSYSETGIASWYGKDFNGKSTANGETYNMHALTAAHRTLPLPSIVRVTNLENGRSLVVRINDRGPFSRGRIVDLSKRGAQLLGFEKEGTAMVQVDILPRESRAAAAKLNSRLYSKDNPPPPFPAPRVQVTSRFLKPPANGRIAWPPTANHRVAALPEGSRRKRNRFPNMAKVDGTVTRVPIPYAPGVYIQAGAYQMFVNAHRARARLGNLGLTRIIEVPHGKSQIFRVRIGPLHSVAQADALLAAVSATGYRDARIVIE